MQIGFKRFQSLFYWITYSYPFPIFPKDILAFRFNPYFTGLPILISCQDIKDYIPISFNPYFTGLPILIIIENIKKYGVERFNPYFTGLPILILTSG